MKKLLLLILLSGCATVPTDKHTEICDQLMDQRLRQVINNHPAASIAETDAMLLKCGCK